MTNFNKLTPAQERRVLGWLRQWLAAGSTDTRFAMPDIAAFLDQVNALGPLEERAVELWIEVFGDGEPQYPDWEERILSWCYLPNMYLGGERPIDVLATPRGIEQVRSEFERIASGSVG